MQRRTITQRIANYFRNPSKFWMKTVDFLSPVLPDKIYLDFKFHHCFGRWIDWQHPRTFSEKLQWLKIYNRKSEYTIMADKVKAKEWVANRIGTEYIIPTLGVWDNPDEIDFDKLPNQFVLKCNHNSGRGMYICKDKSKMDVETVKKKLRSGLKENYFIHGREWPYKNIPRKILAEQYMMDDNGNSSDNTINKNDLADYKFYCFDGEPIYCQVIRDRSTKETIDFYDMEWNHMPFVGLISTEQKDCLYTIYNGSTPVPRPKHLKKMIEICRTLSKGINFVRTDLYVINDKEYFGELTFFPLSGMGEFTPDTWNIKIGNLLNLPKETLSTGGGKILIVNEDFKIYKTNYFEYNIGGLTDYKFTCFNGVVDNVMVCIDRALGNPKFYFFDREWNLLPLNKRGLETPKDFQLPCPPVIDQMFEIAAQLSVGIPYLRVDLYYINNKIYFGETTFFPQSGFDANLLPETDRIFGERIDLSIVEPLKH